MQKGFIFVDLHDDDDEEFWFTVEEEWEDEVRKDFFFFLVSVGTIRRNGWEIDFDFDWVIVKDDEKRERERERVSFSLVQQWFIYTSTYMLCASQGWVKIEIKNRLLVYFLLERVK